MVHVYNGMLAIKKWIWVSSSDVDEPRARFTEWSKSEGEKYSILMYIYGF